MANRLLQAEIDLLVLQAQNGNSEAFAELYRQFSSGLINYAAKFCSDTELAREASQECWLDVSKSIRKLQDIRGFRSWLYKKIRWRVIDLARKQQRVETLSFEETEHESKIPVEVEESISISDALQKLPTIEKQIMHLFYIDDLRIAEISVVLGIPNGTVKSRLNRARNLLKAKFEQE